MLESLKLMKMEDKRAFIDYLNDDIKLLVSTK